MTDFDRHYNESMVSAEASDIVNQGPRIFLIGRPAFDVKAFLAFLAQEQFGWRRTTGAAEAEELVEVAGRSCYMSFGKKQSPRTNAEFIHNLVQMGHESVLEHVSWTFLLTNISRAFTHQLVRHRVGFAFSQLSQQYHDESEASFVMPSYLTNMPEAQREWEKAVRSAKKAYELITASLHRNGVGEDLDTKEANRAIRSAARSILPNATETTIVITVNARALRHFLKVRGSVVGDMEMRQVATELLKAVKKEAPALFFDFDINKLSDGLPIVEYRQAA